MFFYAFEKISILLLTLCSLSVLTSRERPFIITGILCSISMKAKIDRNFGIFFHLVGISGDFYLNSIRVDDVYV